MILYEGKSLLDGAPIVVIATGVNRARQSENAKTGAMVQTFIMRRDIEPHLALKTGADKSVCGNCRHRPANLGSCYVTVWQAPLTVYRAYHRGSYRKVNMREMMVALAGKPVRFGSYGDPAAVPAKIWLAIKSIAATTTGYTHQWRSAIDLMPACMASVDSVEEAFEARAMGWRTFRVRTPDDAMMPKEFVCPASNEAGNKVTCASCKRCSGTDGTRGVPVIISHGNTAVKFNKARIE